MVLVLKSQEDFKVLYNREQINNLIPQSPPFLLLNTIIDATEDMLLADYTFSATDEFFKGHFPNDPIVPGVLLCECCLQAGAVFLALKKQHKIQGKAVVTKMDKVKFKNFLRPDQKILIQVNILETIDNFMLMKGKITFEEKLIMSLEFMVGVTA